MASLPVSADTACDEDWCRILSVTAQGDLMLAAISGRRGIAAGGGVASRGSAASPALAPRVGRRARHACTGVRTSVQTTTEIDSGIGLHVIEQGLDTQTVEGRAMFGMLSVLAELQRELIVANTNDGLAPARARGRVGGRRPNLTPRPAPPPPPLP